MDRAGTVALRQEGMFAAMIDEAPLKLSAHDEEDLRVISACLQDAVICATEFAYEAGRHRFAAMFRRFRWEDQFAESQGPTLRVRSAVHFDSVVAARYRGLDPGSDEVLQLLAIDVAGAQEGATRLEFRFAGGGTIRLEVECIDCYLTDLGKPWPALRRPGHPVAED